MSELLVLSMQGLKVETETDNGYDHQNIEFHVSTRLAAIALKVCRKG